MSTLPDSEAWRLTHLGRLLAMAGQRFDSRVLVLMAHSADLSLALSHLAARGRLGASHIQITRHLPLAGCSLTTLAARAGITKQAMGKLVDQCAAWGLVFLRTAALSLADREMVSRLVSGRVADLARMLGVTPRESRA